MTGSSTLSGGRAPLGDRSGLQSPNPPTVEDLRALLAEVYDWIVNWSPDFTEDDEWPETAAKVRAALSPKPTEAGE